jgi:hypothetical protein
LVLLGGVGKVDEHPENEALQIQYNKYKG